MSAPRSPRPHASVHLPPLDGHEALLFVNILERLISAIWRAHGHAMRDTLKQAHASEPPARRKTSPSSPARNPHHRHDELPF